MLPKILGIIPARMASKRLPGKPLIDIEGTPMIGHVYQRSKMAIDLLDVYVATCDKEISEYISSIDGKVIMTKNDVVRSTDRVAEALRKIEAHIQTKIDIVVMIQGDEPLVNPEMIANSISPLLIDTDIQITCLMTEIYEEDEIDDTNAVKVVVDNFNNALYLSRCAIPYQQRGVYGLPHLKKINVSAIRRDFLYHFTSLPQSPLELVEDIGMLRIIENSMKLKMVMTESYTVSVDTKKDLEIVRDLMKEDLWYNKYK